MPNPRTRLADNAFFLFGCFLGIAACLAWLSVDETVFSHLLPDYWADTIAVVGAFGFLVAIVSAIAGQPWLTVAGIVFGMVASASNSVAMWRSGFHGTAYMSLGVLGFVGQRIWDTVQLASGRWMRR